MTGIGYFPARHLLDWLQHGGTFLGLESWLIAFSVIGVWLLLTAWRRGHFLEVELAKDRKRLAFRGRPDPAEIRAFVTAVESRLGLKILRDTWG